MEQAATELEKKYGYRTVSTGIVARLFRTPTFKCSRAWVHDKIDSGELVDDSPEWSDHAAVTVESIARLMKIPVAEVYDKIETLSTVSPES